MAFGVVLAVLTVTTYADAARYFLSPSGADSNAGTVEAPWRTFAFAIPKLRAGDTLVLRNGIYDSSNSGMANISCGSNAANGTSSQRITIEAENERQAFLRGNGSYVPLNISNCSYWVVQGLRLASADLSGVSSGSGEAMMVNNSPSLMIRRNLFQYNNRFCNCHLLTISNSSNPLIEENEFYNYHRYPILVTYLESPIIRRNYMNSRNWADIPGGYPSDPSNKGDVGIGCYPCNNGIFENNIIENTGTGINQEASGAITSNKFLGNISLNNDRAWRTTSRGSFMPQNSLLQDWVIINPLSTGIYSRSAKTTQIQQMTIIGSSSNVGGVVADQDSSNPGDNTYSISGENILTVNSLNGYGVNIVTSPGTWSGSFKYVNAYNNAAPYNFGAISATSVSTTNPQLGSCRVFIPASSPMYRAGNGGRDIGANVLYAYENGILQNGSSGTSAKRLWDPSTGAFVFAGAVVTGVNDVAGASLFDLQNRLNVNKNGCALPQDYNAGGALLPSAPTNLTLSY